ncbi:MAG: galactose-1-phosphate uridylyltransferase [Candidatus Omnitrophica bacterium]|nr:galactose-1-phosphate uridylyltransferase [Candidatus Omnitrophota bacterium]
MPELRRDPIIGRWVIIATERAKRPSAFLSFPKDEARRSGGKEYGESVERCPFCEGNESLTPPEITADRTEGQPNSPGWTVRVVPNKYPALEREGNLEKKGVGIFDTMNGVGAHEVIIDIPEHSLDIADISDGQSEKIIKAYLGRSVELKADQRYKYILIFRNYGRSAGASLEHPHSQLIALPIVPKRVNEELHSSLEYFNCKDRCVFCDILAQEAKDKERIVEENKFFISFCPFVSRFPYEIWIMPKEHRFHFSGLKREEIKPLGVILRDSMKKLKKLLDNPPYNYIIHTAPINGQERDYYHWHIEIMPKLVNVAGFEWGSGFYVNPVPPEEAANKLTKA